MRQYERFELEAESATLVSPSGVEYKLTAFAKQEIELEYECHGYESAKPIGEPKRVVRFYPSEVGIWKLDANGSKSELEVEAAPGGYVTVDKRDPRYFALSDGTPWYPVGINLAFISPVGMTDGKEFGQKGRAYLGMRKYEYWFRRLSENGVNLARIWLGQEYLCPDTAEAGVLDPIQLEKLDILLGLAEKYGIRLKITLEQFRHFNYERVAESNSYDDDIFRKFNKKLYKNGRRCESVAEWKQERIWRDAWKETLEGLAQRLAGNPYVFGIELWNEMNCLGRDNLVDWNEEMLPYLKTLFPKQLVMNSIGSFDSDSSKSSYEIFCWDKSDVMQMHRYLDQGAKYEVCNSNPIELIRDGIARLTSDSFANGRFAGQVKPFIVAETGGVNDCHSGPFRYYTIDDEGMIFRDLVYTPVFCGASGCGHIWHWDERYVETKNLYKYFTPIAKLGEGIDFAAEGFEPGYYKDDKVTLLTLRGKSVTLGYLRNNSYNWESLLRDLGTPEAVDFELPFDSGELEVIDCDGKVEGMHVSELGFGMLFRVR